MTAADLLALPGPLRLTPSSSSAARELATLQTLLTDAGSEGGRVALLAGEPG